MAFYTLVVIRQVLLQDYTHEDQACNLSRDCNKNHYDSNRDGSSAEVRDILDDHTCWLYIRIRLHAYHTNYNNANSRLGNNRA